MTSFPFRRERRPEPRWTRPGQRESIGLLATLRPFVLGGIAAVTWPAIDPALIEPPAFLSSAPEQVREQFTRCGPGRGHACVIDGDTIKIGSRKVRIIGIDAPETHPANCAEEARLGELATAKLQGLLNQGPFEMVGRSFNDQDRYGRDLRALSRARSDGSMQSTADDMRASGLAHRYLGGYKSGWC